MSMTRLARLTAALALALVPAVAFGQTADAPPKHVPLQKTIGQTRPEVVPTLIVMNSEGATLKDGKLVLTGIAKNSILFADRPVRAAGHALTTTLLEEWAEGSDSFAADPPNATVSVFGETEDAVYDAVVVLKSPVLDGTTLTFDVDVLEGSLDGAKGGAAIFIDIIGRPMTPISYAGAARRTADNAAWYGAHTAAAVGAGMVAGAAIADANHPYYPPPAYYSAPPPPGYAYPPYCGYAPYPPCY
jgi:hypothetical protein